LKTSNVDILVIGAGILGVASAYWLSRLYDCSVAVVDSAPVPGAHTSSRNTGVIHRPYYLDPTRKKVFARTSLASHPLWEALAAKGRLPWKPVGTFNVAVEEDEVKTIEKYRRWGLENGMSESELDLLNAGEVKTLEPEVRCKAGLLSKTDVSVDFGVFTRYLWGVAADLGARFLGGHRVLKVADRRGLVETEAETATERTTIRSKLVINAAGGGSLAIAHSCGLAGGLAALNFRGEYWVVDEPFASRVTSNIYRPPSFPQYPFLDPHFVVRADGSRQIGPNAVAVPGPYVYSGVGLRQLPGFLSRPVAPKRKLLTNADFISLLVGEWRSSLSKKVMCGRVQKFVPGLRPEMLNRRAVFGVRSSVVNREGFVPEAVLRTGAASIHVINFNSPGATGAPAFSALVVQRIRSEGMLAGFRQKIGVPGIPRWDFDTLLADLGRP